MRKRLVWVDIAKGIAIILMIIGHEISGNIRTFIFSFHMPLFFILSGFTSGAVLTYSKWKSKLPKILEMLILVIFMIILLSVEKVLVWKGSVSQIALDTLIGIFQGSNTYGGVHAISTVGVMWFLIVFVWAKILFDLLQVFFDNKYIGVILGIISYFAYLISLHHWLPQDLDIIPIAALFMWIGLVAKNIKIKQIGKMKNYLIILSLTYWLICMRLHLFIELVIRHYPLFIVTILEAAAGTFIVCLFSKWLVPWAQKLQIVGQHTLAVLCIHHLDLYWVNWDSYILSFHSWLLASIARLVVDVTILGLFLFVQRWIMARKVK